MRFKIKDPNIALITAAIHDGHDIRDDLSNLLKVGDEDRLREEDPYTAKWLTISPNTISTNVSRFEVDLNRPREKAIYIHPVDSWGLRVWKSELKETDIAKSLKIYDLFYMKLKETLDYLTSINRILIIYDIHSYNYRRNGSNQPPEDDLKNPEINLGTGTMNRNKWEPIIEQFLSDVRAFNFEGRSLDIRENIKFKGGNFPKWIHDNYPDSVCCLSIEFRKFFMDEWTGIPDPKVIRKIRKLLNFTLVGVMARLKEMES